MPQETSTQRKRRLEKEKHKRQEKLQIETEENKSKRLLKRRKICVEVKDDTQRLNNTRRQAQKRANETVEKHILRLSNQKRRQTQLRANESDKETSSRLLIDKERHTRERANESTDKGIRRLADQKKRQTEIRANETVTETSSRLFFDKERHTRDRTNETAEKYIRRLTDQKKRQTELRVNETVTETSSRLFLDMESHAQRRANETVDECKLRLDEQKKRQTKLRANETVTETSSRLFFDMEYHAQRRANETVEECKLRLDEQNKRQAEFRAKETEEQIRERLCVDRKRHIDTRLKESSEMLEERLRSQQKRQAANRMAETSDRHAVRVFQDALHHSQERAKETCQERDLRLKRKKALREKRAADVTSFYTKINSFCDKCCEICLKKCYPNQIIKYCLKKEKLYLPHELSIKSNLLVCHRCNVHLKSSKTHAPSKPYWNNLLPGDICDEIASLTEPEVHLLQRITPYVKVIKFPGRFGQYGFKGHATLFALDIFEVSEKIEDMLPRSSADASMVIVTETLENLNISRDYSISPHRVFNALKWLIVNNPLYKDVNINQFARLDTQDVFRIIPVQQEGPNESEDNLDNDTNDGTIRSYYNPINDFSRILRASWNQGNGDIFISGHAGHQCFAMVIANIIRAKVLPPCQWNINVLNQNMIEGDELYELIDFETKNLEGAFPIDDNGFLEIRNLDVVKNDVLMFENAFIIEYDDLNGSFNGSVYDKENDGENFLNLHTSITTLFEKYSFATLIVTNSAYGLIKSGSKFYFSDSHSCGPKGKRCGPNGKACIIECDSIDELIRIIRRTVFSRPGIQYSINSVVVNLKEKSIEKRDDILNTHPVGNTPSPVINCFHDNAGSNLSSTSYQVLTYYSKILLASWNQANEQIFQSGHAGHQCFAMVIANFIRASILTPSRWDTNVLNENMLEGDVLYALIDWETRKRQEAYPIDINGFLEVRNLDVVKHDILMFDNAFSVEYDDLNGSFNGSLCDIENDGVNFLSLEKSLIKSFDSSNNGILIVSGSAFGLLHYEHKFYFTDSHSCDKNGKHGSHSGTACVIQCDNIEELIRIIRRTTGSKGGTQFSINTIQISEKQNLLELQKKKNISHLEDDEHSNMLENSSQFVAVQTCVMAPIDHEQPDVNDEFEENRNIREIYRKTKDNIVNVNRELKAEEYSWFNLFPYGKNGLHEDRPVQITPLDYFQQRILGSDTRFQRTDYLFYALSMFEYMRVQSTINACGRAIRGQEGVIEDLHLYLKNLRGSSSYWRTAHNELIAFIRCIGPPTWFITLSSNDLHWPDMRKAFLIADGRPNEDSSQLNIDEVQRLIELYPVVLSRHFSRRVDAFMAIIKQNDKILGGKVVDFWYRIEFQNRGSPHVHLVVWIQNAPAFESIEGINLIDQVISCAFPLAEEDPDLRALVKRNQLHKHTHTCHKNNSTTCRFAFPRKPCSRTRIVPHSSDEFIRNGGRFCTIKRTSNEKWVNNYNQEILEFWDANMDIQPCGSNESIAHYIAKYISKTEPVDVNDGVAQAIREIRREESNISRKLFKSCMRILKERQVSASECVYRLCHLPLRSSSRKCVFLNTRKPEQRYHVLRFEDNQAVGLCSNVFERYINRPKQNEQGYDFPKMSLIEFAMNFEPFYAKKAGENEESIDAETEDQPTRRRLIKLANNSKVVIRNTPAVVRIPYFQMHTDPENYFYSLLLQYLPFYSEEELIGEYSSSREAFLAREEELKQSNENLEIHRARDKQLETAFNQAHAFNLLMNPQDTVEPEFEEVVEEQEMTNEQFQSICSAMNINQRELFRKVTRSIQEQMNGNASRIRMFVTGGAGVGKTFTFNALKEQVNRCYGKKAVKVTALTGVAARLVHGSTLHSLLKLPVEKDGKIIANLAPLTGNFLKIMRNQWKDIEFIFIDEISMVSYEMLCMIDSRLRQLKKKENQPFGEMNIMVFGDFFQLPPIRGAQAFTQPSKFLPSTHLWRLFSLIELTENMRQQGDTSFIDLLNALRIGEMKAKHFDILMSKILSDTSENSDFDKAIRIYPTRAQVDSYNASVLEKYRSQGEKIFKIKAQDVIVNATRNTDNVNIDNIISNDINKTGGLQKNLEIFVGAKVMLRSNINIEKGLVNGAMGYITEIVWPLFRKDQMYDKDIPDVRIDLGKDGIQLIKPKSIQFQALRNYGTVERTQLPIILCWACTVHKMQGCTVDQAVVYLGSALFAKGQAYVALSRVKSIDGLRIEELECSKLTGMLPCNEEAVKEMKRMRAFNT